ncbi:MAG: hypothetical protein ACREHF_00590 [Rhizomicrobium sp.]
MKSFADTSFFLLFDDIVRNDRPKDDPASWTAAGVTWHYARHTYEGQRYGFTIEVFQAECPAKGGWSLTVSKEHWWAGRHGKVVRSARWAKPLRGKRSRIFEWLRQRQQDMRSGD